MNRRDSQAWHRRRMHALEMQRRDARRRAATFFHWWILRKGRG